MNDSPQATPETETAEPARKKSFAPLIYGTSIVFALYVLSVGPACRLNESGVISEECLRTLYSPLIPVSQSSRTLRHFFTLYVNFWVHDSFGDGEDMTTE